MTRLVVGTRGSALALWQTNYVLDALKHVAPDLEIGTRIVKTAGDRHLNRPLTAFGTQGVFTDAIENALRAHVIDFAVHSLKDLPTRHSDEFLLAAILERADARDVLVSRHAVGLMQLPRQGQVGTGSTRRAAQILALRPDLYIAPLRGNVDTRLHKAQTFAYDAIVIAAAGVLRLGRGAEITEYLELDSFLPDPGQGALAVQIRIQDTPLVALFAQLDHAPTRAATSAERAFLSAWGGGCALPIAAYAEMRAGVLQLQGLIGARNGQRVIRGVRTGSPNAPVEIGYALAEDLRKQGAPEL